MNQAFWGICLVLLPGALCAGPAPAGQPDAWLPSGISLEQPYQGFVGPEACRECHADHVESQYAGAHFLASLPATAGTIFGSFDPGRNRLPTRQPDQELVMWSDDRGHYQSLVTRQGERDIRLRSGQFAIVIGTVKGQTYLYWRDDVLCQLPASYVGSADAWAYSPGYPEGVPWFDRVVRPDCMECHATVFETVLPDRIVKTEQAVLGVTCEACHGPGEAHVRHHRAHPEASAPAHMTKISGLTREQQVEACGYCHAGVKPGSRRRPAFSFRPGDRLADFFELKPVDASAQPEVHGNQLGLLQQSACYRESENLTCTSCHAPHADPQAGFAASCLACHTDLAAHAGATAVGELVEGCIDCHMPLVDSQLIDVAEHGRTHHFAVRSHWIRVPDAP